MTIFSSWVSGSSRGSRSSTGAGVTGAEEATAGGGSTRGGFTKRHEPTPNGRVRKLFSAEGFGFIETDEGREIYFDRRSVLHGAFARLAIGSKVRFAEEPGERGPQASTVELIQRPRA